MSELKANALVRGWRGIGAWCAACVLIVVLYLAGIGPAVWTANRTVYRAPAIGDVLAAAYRPVFAIAECQPRCSRLLHAYIDLWCPPNANAKFGEVRDALQ